MKTDSELVRQFKTRGHCVIIVYLCPEEIFKIEEPSSCEFPPEFIATAEDQITIKVTHD